jgi:hypothetical protein
MDMFDGVSKRLCLFLCVLLPIPSLVTGQEITITAFDARGVISWSNTFWNTTCRVESAEALLPASSNSWSVVTNVWTTGAVASATFAPSAGAQGFYRVGYASSLFSGLAGDWPFDGTASDRSRNANNGVTHGVTATTNRAGADSAFYFDGSGTYVSIADSSSLDPTNMSLAFWFRLDSSATAREFVNKMGAEGTRSLSFGSEYSGSDRKIRFRICTDGWLGTLTDCASASTIATGTWYHFAGTYDGTAMRVYINGALENSVPKSGAIFNSSEEVKVGRYGYYSGWVLHGAVDNVIIWNRALSSNEVWQVYSGQSL